MARLIRIRFARCSCFGAVIREKVSAITNTPKFRRFWRISIGSLLSSRMAASMNTIQSRRLYSKASERPDGGFWSHASRAACRLAAAFRQACLKVARIQGRLRDLGIGFAGGSGIRRAHP